MVSADGENRQNHHWKKQEWMAVFSALVCFCLLLTGYLFLLRRDIASKKEIYGYRQRQDSLVHQNVSYDEVVDNMIVRKKGEQYVMVIQCKGLNFDLLGEDEKIAVESGFVQFLNIRSISRAM